MPHQPLDPRICPVAIDANALDCHGDERTRLVKRLLELKAAGTIRLIVPRGVRIEVQNPCTPASVQAVMEPQIFSLPVPPTDEERRCMAAIHAVLGKHAADADHLFEANKYACYFITHDKRILTRAGQLVDVLRPSLKIVTLAGFFDIFDSDVNPAIPASFYYLEPA